MLVSIVVPTYNRPERLANALESIALQREAQFEVIVVNDGGVDVSDVVAHCSDRMSLQHVRLSSNGGLAQARNEGIRRARGEVLTFLDDDDVMLPGHLATGSGALAKSNSEVVYAQVAVCDELIPPGTQPLASQIKAHYRCPFDTRLLQICNFIPVNAIFVQRRAVDDVIFDATLGLLEDWELWLRLHLRLGYRFSSVPATTAVYHRVPGSGSMTGRADEVARFGSTFRTVVERYPSSDALVQRGRAAHARFYNDVAPIDRASAFSYERFVSSMEALLHTAE